MWSLLLEHYRLIVASINLLCALVSLVAAVYVWRTADDVRGIARSIQSQNTTKVRRRAATGGIPSPKEYTVGENPSEFRVMTHFVPDDKDEHEKGNRGVDVPDYCRNCGHPFMEHTNGKCPEEKVNEERKDDDRRT